MKKLLFMLAALCLMTSVGYCQEKAQPLQRFDKSSPLALTIKSDKRVYEAGEEIKLTATLINNSDKEQIVFWSNKNPAQASGGGGTTLSMPNASPADALYIKPKEAVEKTLRAGSAGSLGPAFTFVFDNTWALLLNVLHTSNQEKFEGSLTSNTITIEVKGKS